MQTDIYIIQPGDTLTSIADKFQITLHDLTFLNDISGSEPLVVGQSILFPHRRMPVVSLAYFQLNRLDDLARTLKQIGQSITYGALFQLPVTTDGVFIIPQVQIQWYVALLYSFHILPLLVITNLGPERFDPDLAKAVIRDETLRVQTIQNLVRILSHYGFAGVNIDFENVAAADRDLFTDFIKTIKLVLGSAGYLVTLTVPPKNSDTSDQTQDAYDYKALGNWADLVFIMTYDWGYMGGPPMAVAPLNEIQKVLSYALSKIPSFKIIQGIPLYGYDWPIPFTQGVLAKTVTLIEVYHIAQRFGAQINYDPLAQSPYFNYTDETGQEHVVWFEDTRSVRAKYAGARNLDLGGVGFWSGQNNPYGFQQNWITLNEIFQIKKN
ncbi:MAG TPA: hypothetical protein DDW50_08415 [Firmicutes bacterium]|jgi:spore germination protein|nr:hypothetical protein [Bacillota bacterium]